MRLKRLTLSGFRSFVEPTTITFPDSGVVMLRGVSGSGKTSILLGVSYALGFCPYPATQLRSWVEAPFRVELELEVDGKALVVTRGDKLSLKVDNVTVSGTAKQLETKLQELLLPTAMLEAMTWRGQRRDGMFLAMGDTDRKKFLTELLGLDRFEAAVDAAGSASASAKLAADSWAAELERIRNQVTGFRNVVEPQPSDPSLAPALIEAEKKLVELRAQVNAIEVESKRARAATEAEAKSIHERARVQLASLAPPPPEPVSETATVDEIREVEALIQTLTHDHERALQRFRDRERLQQKQKHAAISSLKILEGYKSDRDSFRHQLQALAQNLCPTCSRTWAEAEAKIKDIETEIAGLDKALAKEDSIKSEISRYEAEEKEMIPPTEPETLPEARSRLLALNQELASFLATAKARAKARDQEFKMAQSQILDAGKAEELRLRSEAEAEADTVREHLRQLHRQIQEVSDTERALRTRIQDEDMVRARAQTLYEHAQSQILLLEAEEKEVLARLESSMIEYREQADVVAALGRDGFLGRIFDEVLAETATYCNDFLRKFPNTERCSLRWVSETQTKSGTTSRTLTPILSFGGVEAPFKSGCSGGMFSVLDLAMDLALAHVMGRRLGRVPGWIILDEAFDGMGALEKEAALEFLEEVGRERLVLVVDHDAVIVEGRHRHVDVVLDNGRSRIL